MPVVNPQTGEEWSVEEYLSMKKQWEFFKGLLVTGSQTPSV